MALSCFARSWSTRLSSHITKPLNKCNVCDKYPVRVLSSGFKYERFHYYRPSDKTTDQFSCYGISPRSCRQFNTSCSSLATPSTPTPPEEEPPKKVGLMQRLKTMYKDYWYVVVPVHFTTSAMWFGGLYYTVSSGVDVVSLLKTIGVSETLLAPLKDSSAGYFALTFALYKVVSPLRYAATIGFTTIAIKQLTALGWIKPVPSKKRIKEMIQVQKTNIQDSLNKRYQDQKDKKNKILEDVRRYKDEIKSRMKKM